MNPTKSNISKNGSTWHEDNRRGKNAEAFFFMPLNRTNWMRGFRAAKANPAQRRRFSHDERGNLRSEG